MLKVTITGLESSLRKIQNNYEAACKEIDAEMGAVTESMITTSKQLLPAQYGALRSSLRVKKNRNFSYTLGTNIEYAPYIEFGTGPYAKKYVPTLEREWQDYALTFKKSIPGNTYQSPYFYPSIRSWSIILLNNLSRILKRYERY
jgi:hypothetical protein